VRGTAGGDRLESSRPPATHVASIPCVNLLLNSVVSTDAFFGSVDLTDFYLGTDLLHPQFIKLHTHLFSDSVLSRLNLLPFLKHDPSGKPYLLFRIDKTMYGLKEAGKHFAFSVENCGKFTHSRTIKTDHYLSKNLLVAHF
jgi:hypothetical protein